MILIFYEKQAELDLGAIYMNAQRYRFGSNRCHTQHSQLFTKYTENVRCIIPKSNKMKDTEVRFFVFLLF